MSGRRPADTSRSANRRPISPPCSPSTSRPSRCWCGGSIARARSLETVAVGFAGIEHRLGDARADCSAAELKTLLDWCRRGKVVHRRGQSTSLARGFFASWPGSARGRRVGRTAWAIRQGNCGVLVFLAPGGPRLSARACRAGSTPVGAVFGGAGERPAAARDDRASRGRRGRQAIAVDPAGTQDAGRHDRWASNRGFAR